MAAAGGQRPPTHTTPRSTPGQRFETPGGRVRGEKGGTLGDYRIVKTLGEGSFGKVRRTAPNPPICLFPGMGADECSGRAYEDRAEGCAQVY